MFALNHKALHPVLAALGVLAGSMSSAAHASPCRQGYQLRDPGICVSTRDIQLSCDSSIYNNERVQLTLQSYPGRQVYCFKNVGGDQTNIVFGNPVKTAGCLYQHPRVDGQNGSAVNLDFCASGPRPVYLLDLEGIICDSAAGVSETTCHHYYRP